MAILPKPAALPEWASTGSIVEPSAGKKELGFVPAEQPPAEHLNWLLNTIYEWQAYLDSFPYPLLHLSDAINVRPATEGTETIETITADTYTDVDNGSTIVSITGVQAGDILELSGHVHARFDAPAARFAYIQVTADGTTLQNLSINDVDNQIRQYQLMPQLYTITDTSVEIKLQGRVNNTAGSPTPTLTVIGPLLLRARVYRPG